ncbi:hypothetical protein [Bacillus sp. T3]|uniref:hypothetical protein n=1 Tax=Bacillus sp. T3 TaxID=467262 RepID=UPI002980FF0D|nr:hypothetical protein [Bacillus sp. T3]
MVAPLGNCPKCGKLFLKVRMICDDCYDKQEEDYRKVSSYLWDYPGTTIEQLNRATEVTVSQIRQFILSNRIIVSQYTNLEYPCENCGTMIKEGKTCKACLGNINQLAQNVEKEIQNEENGRKTGSYKYRN